MTRICSPWVSIFLYLRVLVVVVTLAEVLPTEESAPGGHKRHGGPEELVALAATSQPADCKFAGSRPARRLAPAATLAPPATPFHH